MSERRKNQLPLVLGLNAAYHESAAAIVRGGEVRFAAEEERYTREKHAKVARVTNPDQLPWFAIRDCLRAANCAKLSDVDAVAYSLMPGKRLAMIGTRSVSDRRRRSVLGAHGESALSISASAACAQIARRRGESPDAAAGFHFVPHHLAHAACAFHASGLPSAAVLVVDGIGESATTWLGRGGPAGLEMIEEIPYPHSIGMLWERMAEYLGFGEYDAAKVMGLAAFGDPQRFAAAMDRLFHVHARQGDKPWPAARASVCGESRSGPLPRRRRGGSGIAVWKAASSGRIADGGPLRRCRGRFAEANGGCLAGAARRLKRATGESSLAYGGGVALNCVANSRLERDGPFEAVHVYAAPHDAGTAIGAALETAHRLAGRDRFGRGHRRHDPLTPFLGGQFDDEAIDAALARWGLAGQRAADPELRAAASTLADGRIVAWFQGRMEFGPRALGNRSLLADPQASRKCARGSTAASSIGNRSGRLPLRSWRKKRQPGSSSPRIGSGRGPRETSCSWLTRVRPDVRSRDSGRVHADGTCRIQTVSRQRQPRFHRLIAAFFQMTGVPVILNTSYNEQEPLVLTPDDALATFLKTPYRRPVSERSFGRASGVGREASSPCREACPLARGLAPPTGSCWRRRGTATAFAWRWSSATRPPAGNVLTTPPGSVVIAISGRAKAPRSLPN